MRFWRRQAGDEPGGESDTEGQLRQMVPMEARIAYTSSSQVRTQVVEVGTVRVPSGSVAVGDPGLGGGYLLMVPVPAGSHRVYGTTFEHVYDDGRRKTFTGAVSLVLAEGERVSREILREASGGNDRPEEELHWVSVDTGACGFADAAAITAALESDRWDDFMYREMASIRLPWVATLPAGGDLVAVESGLGDGGYPVFGDYDARGALLAVHVNFALVTQDDLAGIGPSRARS